MYLIRTIFLAVSGLFILGCSTASVDRVGQIGDCQFDGVSFDADFQSGRLSGCEQTGKNQYDLYIEPESIPAHHSPWYAFRVVADSDSRITVRLRYTEKEHRYPPKISYDKQSWNPLPASNVKEILGGKGVRLRLDVSTKPLYVAGQEIIDNNHYDLWEEQLVKMPFVSRSVLGKSELGRPVYKLETNSADSGNYLVLVGRQHPPEITGALAMFHFINALMADTPLAKQFRSQVNLLIVSNMNPDGVALGHWRKNVNGIDLNRDWGPFEQAETKLIRDELQRFAGDSGEQMLFFLDFHSTKYDIFYTMSEGLPGDPAREINTWLGNLQARMPDYEVRTRASYRPEFYISKNYIYKTFGIPAVTYEIGDNTDRQLIRQQATVAAEEMMKLLLK